MNKAGCREKLSVSRFSSFFILTQHKRNLGRDSACSLRSLNVGFHLRVTELSLLSMRVQKKCITEACGAIWDNFIFCVHSIHVGLADNTASTGASLSRKGWCGTTGSFPASQMTWEQAADMNLTTLLTTVGAQTIWVTCRHLHRNAET